MLTLPLRLLLALLLAAAQTAHAGSLELAAKMQEAGANELALAYLLKNAPPKADAAWGQWAALEIKLLSRFGKNQDVLDIASNLPFSRDTALLAAKSAFDLGKPALARDWLAQFVWHGNPSKTDLRQARLGIIDSYIDEQDGKSGYYAMLRFNQDYRPQTKAEADRFVAGLLTVGMAKDTVPWLTLLDDADPVKIRAELQTGLISPDEALAVAKSLPDIRLEAAKMKGDASLEIKALEALVSAGKVSSGDLWDGYLDHAVAYSNQYALLQGDYAAWFDAVGKMDDPYAQRSLLAYLSRHAASPESKSHTVSLMIASLKDAPVVAIGLFSKSSDLSLDARLTLGQMAFQAGDYADCTHFWDGLQGANLPDLALAWLKTGQPAKAASTLNQYLHGVQALTPDISSRILTLVRQIAATKEPTAIAPLTALLSLVDPGTQREVLMLLGQVSSDPQSAAAYYFEAATLIQAKQSDDLARRARLACAENLQKAGFTQDAKNQYQWLLGRTRDPAVLREIKRRLQ